MTTEMNRRPSGRSNTANIESVIRRDTIQLSNRVRYMRRLRLDVYNFLDHPLSSRSAWYHFGVFAFVLMAVIFGATTDSLKDQFFHDIYFYMEVTLAVFFLSEFLIRMWAVSADAKYIGLKGRLYYLSRLVGITDIIIISVTFAILFIEKHYISENTMDYLRLIQILRLFHIDRQMTTWRLIKNMVILSKWELFATYYITFIIFLVMANSIYYTENYDRFYNQASHNDINLTIDGDNSTSAFPTLAHAWWFTIVSILTIGYGDIVPNHWISKVTVCVLGFLAYCTFVAASTQISVGLTLMMEEDNKKECKNKLRNTAASVIQCWYRYHLASDEKKDTKTTYFTHICYKLYLTEERINKNRQLERKLKEKLERRKRLRNPYKLQAPSQHHTISAGDSQNRWKNSLKQGITQQMLQPINIDAGDIRPKEIRKLSRFNRNMSLPDNELRDMRQRLTQQNSFDLKTMFDHRNSTDTNISSSLDTSDVESHIEIKDILKNSQGTSIDLSDIDESLLYKYRPLLRFFNFLLFRDYTKKFQRMRKSDKILEIEAEIREQEYARQQNLKELEIRINAVVGKPTISPFNKTEGEKLCISRRLDLCEEKINEIGKKMDHIINIAKELVKISEATSIKSHHSRVLPPSPSSKRQTKILRRQHTVHHIMKEEGTDAEE